MIYWYENLSFLRLLSLIIFKQFKVNKVYYLEISFIAKLCLDNLQKNNFLKWIDHKDVYLGVKDDNDEALKYKAETITNTIISNFDIDNKYIPKYLLEFEDRIKTALRAEMVTIFRLKVYIICAIHLISKNEKNNIIFLDSFPLDKFFVKFVNELMNEITVCLNLNIFKLVKGYFPFKFFNIFIGYIVNNKSQFKECNTKSKIYLEFVSHRFVDNSSTQIFWYDKNQFDSSRIIMGITRNDSKFSKENINLIQKYDMSWINCPNRKLLSYILNPFKLLKKIFKNMSNISKFSLFDFWLWINIFEFTFLMELWRNIFKRFNIKIFHQFQEHTFKSHYQALAIKLEGGFYFWYHWSIDRFLLSHFNNAYSDIFFSWGKFHRDYIEAHDYKYDYIIDVGVTASQINASKDKSELSFENINDKFKIGIFEIGGGIRRWTAFSLDSEIYFYKSILSMIKNNSDWIGFLKPRKEKYLESLNSKEIEILIEELKEQNKLIYLSSNEYTPIDVGNIVDVCLCNGINSAGTMVAMSSETKILYWDLHGNSRHPFYLNGKGTIIFNNVNEVEHALNQLYLKKDLKIGDHSSWRNILDSYFDKKANFRVREFFKEFLTLIDENNNKIETLKEVVNDFKNKWGDDKVFIFKDKESRLNDNIWLNAESKLKK